jgi:C4-dicarboxylate-specific signal transduction histidine kinase
MQLTASEAKQRFATLRSELADGLPPVLADPVQLQQVLINLIVNGMDAMGSIRHLRHRIVLQPGPCAARRCEQL